MRHRLAKHFNTDHKEQPNTTKALIEHACHLDGPNEFLFWDPDQAQTKGHSKFCVHTRNNLKISIFCRAHCTSKHMVHTVIKKKEKNPTSLGIM
jgi:hypothetical protein